MYKINDYVRYGAKGVFKIIEIKKGKENTKLDWFTLYSNTDGVETKIITPSSNTSLRKVMSKEEALLFLHKLEHLKFEWDINKRSRDEDFHEVLSSGNLLDMGILMKSIHFTKLEKNKEGKDISQKDKDIYTNAEKLLFEELSAIFDINKEEVIELILSHVQN